MSFLTISHLEKDYSGHPVVKDFNLSIEKGEFVSFLGPSGCGKTTTLRMVAGFETPSAGSIHINGQDVVALKPNQRNIGMVFQSYALFPNMTVAENVAFGLKVAKRPSSEIASTVAEMLAMIKLESLGKRYPFQLSGGQQQRIALARALAIKPQVLLLDEPLSALDAKIRISLRDEIRSIQRKLGITTIYVTHDQEEALSMSDRIVVMNEGRAEQIDTPSMIYNRPATRFVASFVGTLNVLSAKVLDAERGRIELAGQVLQLAQPLTQARDSSVTLALRPETISLGAMPEQLQLSGVLQEVSFLGSVIRQRVRVGEHLISLDSFNNPLNPPPKMGSTVNLSFRAEDVLVLG